MRWRRRKPVDPVGGITISPRDVEVAFDIVSRLPSTIAQNAEERALLDRVHDMVERAIGSHFNGTLLVPDEVISDDELDEFLTEAERQRPQE